MIVRGKGDEGQPIDIVKVCDFGIAKIAETDMQPAEEEKARRHTTKGMVVGTPGIHVSRAGPGRRARRSQRSLRHRGHSLRAAHGPGAISGRNAPRHGAQAHQRCARAAVVARAERRPAARSHLHEGAGQGSVRPLSRRARDEARPAVGVEPGGRRLHPASRRAAAPGGSDSGSARSRREQGDARGSDSAARDAAVETRTHLAGHGAGSRRGIPGAARRAGREPTRASVEHTDRFGDGRRGDGRRRSRSAPASRRLGGAGRGPRWPRSGHRRPPRDGPRPPWDGPRQEAASAASRGVSPCTGRTGNDPAGCRERTGDASRPGAGDRSAPARDSRRLRLRPR